MNGLRDRTATPGAEALAAYYTRYYRDTLGIPGWRELVAARLDDGDAERARVARLARALGAPIGGRRVLSLGCGTGGFLRAAADAGAAVWGLDPDAEAVALAAGRCPAAAVVVGTGERLPFADGRFDVVHCYSTLEHVADAAATVREMVRVLRRGGHLYIHTPHRLACFESHYKVVWPPGLPAWGRRAWLAAQGRPTAFLDTLRPLTLGECRRLLAAAGARLVRVLDDDDRRRVGGPLWPAIRAYYRIFGIHPHLELLAVRP